MGCELMRSVEGRRGHRANIDRDLRGRFQIDRHQFMIPFTRQEQHAAGKRPSFP